MSVRRILRAARILAAVLPFAAAQSAELPTTHLKVVGGLAATSQFRSFEEPFWTKRLAERSGGRVTAEITAFDQLGLRGPEVLQMTRLGVLAFGTTSLSLIASEDPEAAATDFVGMHPDISSLRRNVAAYRPTLEALYRERYNVELLAIWTYPAQVVFCNRPIARLRDLGGLRVRTASVMHSDFVEALGGIGITLPYAGLVEAFRKHVVDCAITGTMSGYQLGLDDVSTHVHAMTVSWGPSILVANRAVWQRLDPAVRDFLRHELATLDDEIWAAADRETQEGLACNTGTAPCAAGKPGHMTLVPVTDDDRELLQQALTMVVLPRWAERCGRDCVEQWAATVGRHFGVSAGSLVSH
jgi:TRAP-type C4-dicarboxylate transport system substrate-binding protein